MSNRKRCRALGCDVRRHKAHMSRVPVEDGTRSPLVNLCPEHARRWLLGERLELKPHLPPVEATP